MTELVIDITAMRPILLFICEMIPVLPLLFSIYYRNNKNVLTALKEGLIGSIIAAVVITFFLVLQPK